MKVLSTEGLTKLIQLIKSSFISVDDTVTTNTVTLSTVATSGSFNDLTDKPTAYITETYQSGSSWYRVWSNGFIEQGGSGTGATTNAGAKVELLKEYQSDTDYHILAHCTMDVTSTNNTSVWIKTFNKSTSGFYQVTGWTSASKTQYESYPFSWYACGY